MVARPPVRAVACALTLTPSPRLNRASFRACLPHPHRRPPRCSGKQAVVEEEKTSSREAKNGEEGKGRGPHGWFALHTIGLDILGIALPAALALAADPIAALVDTAFVGHLGSAELAAVGVSISVFNLETEKTTCSSGRGVYPALLLPFLFLEMHTKRYSWTEKRCTPAILFRSGGHRSTQHLAWFFNWSRVSASCLPQLPPPSSSSRQTQHQVLQLVLYSSLPSVPPASHQSGVGSVTAQSPAGPRQYLESYSKFKMVLGNILLECYQADGEESKHSDNEEDKVISPLKPTPVVDVQGSQLVIRTKRAKDLSISSEDMQRLVDYQQRTISWRVTQ